MKIDRNLIIYLCKFIFIFLFLYYGTFFFIGITAKGGIYIAWLDEYFNYVRWLRNILLHGSKIVIELAGYNGKLRDAYSLQINNANSVVLVYECLGYGVISYWIAFIIANDGSLTFKLKWLFAGIVIILLSNMLRIAIIAIAVYEKWKISLHIEHHTFYNTISYSIIIILSLLYMKQVNGKLRSV
jgi:exosortase/archaeosortase family protein